MLRFATTPAGASTGAVTAGHHRLLAGSVVALAATLVGSLTLGAAGDDPAASPAAGSGSAITVTFTPAADAAACTVIGSFDGLPPGDVSVRYTALSAGVAFEHPDAGQVVTIGADGTAIVSFAPYQRSGWAGWGNTAIQLSAGDVESGFADVVC